MKGMPVSDITEPAGAWTVLERRIILKNFAVMASIGIHGFEKAAKQRVNVTVELEVRPFEKVGNDEIGSVLDYDFLRDAIGELVDGKHFELQETLCERILEICFSRPNVVSARVATSKPDVYPDCESVGVEVLARRSAG